MAKVLLFGRLADIAGWRQKDVAAQSLSILTANLSKSDPALAAALAGKGVQVAVNQTLVRGDMDLSAEVEVAYLPPMSGG